MDVRVRGSSVTPTYKRELTMTILPKKFYESPCTAITTMNKYNLSELLCYTYGWIVTCNNSWIIESKRLSFNVYKVWLRSTSWQEEFEIFWA